MQTATFQSLSAQFEGAIITPDYADYDEARQVWNGMIDKTPALIVRRVGEHETAYGSRDAQVLLGVESNWENAADDDANIAWAKRVVAEIQTYSNDHQYANFPGLNEGYEKMFGANYQRLQKLKTQYDPTGLFRMK